MSLFIEKLTLIVSITLCIGGQVLCQQFETSAVLGINAAQIDGDTHGGFNKLGFTTGLKTVYNTPTAWAGGLELLLSQRGSQAELVFGSSGFQSKISLNYLEIPVYAIYRLLHDDELDFYGLTFHGGLSYGRLLNVSVSDDSQYNGLTDGFKDNDMSYIFGASYSTSAKLTITGRFTRAFTYLFKDPRPGLDVDALQSFFLTFRIEYKL